MFFRVGSTALAFAVLPLAAQADNLLPGRGAQLGGDWEGFYAGVTAGGDWSTGQARRDDYEGALLTLDVQNGLFPDSIDGAELSGLGGIALGYNVQRGAFVSGVEADYSFTGSDITLRYSRADPNPDPVFNGLETTTAYETDLDSLVTIRLRAGRDFGGTLVYATAGLAAGQIENRFTLALPGLGYTSPGWSDDDVHYGYAAGAGIEQRLSDRATLRVEVMYYNLNDTVVEARDPVSFPSQAIDYRFDNAGFVARFGVNFHF